MNRYKTKFLDKEEAKLISDFNKVKPASIKKPTTKDQQIFKAAASDFLKKEAKMNIRIDPLELDLIKKQAALQGLKYQTFVKSILHKYLTGLFVERL